MTKLQFHKGNSKLHKSIYTFSLPAGWSCPQADICLAKVDPTTIRMKDGPNTEFRCFAASAELVFTSVRVSRWRNFEAIKQCGDDINEMRDLILRSLPPQAKIIRVHVSGDFFKKSYFQAWVDVAKARPDIIFYGYTKQIQYLLDHHASATVNNFRFVASYGGKQDYLLREQNSNQVLPVAFVVLHPNDAKELGLEIDHDDSCAIRATSPFALLIHGIQPKNTGASTAIKRLNTEKFQYGYNSAPSEIPHAVPSHEELLQTVPLDVISNNTILHMCESNVSV